MKAVCQLSEGTLLGAVKTGSILPWDLDADVVVGSDGFDKVLEEVEKVGGIQSN